MKKFNLQNSATKSHIILLLFCLGTLFMGIGYAAINSVTFNITGTAVAKAQQGIFITDVNYVSSNNANQDDSKINNYYQTMLNSSIVLSEEADSSITYEITIHNSTNLVYIFDKVTYGNDYYSNENIGFEIIDMAEDKTIKAKGYLTFKIKFYYINENDISKTGNKLDSYLNFLFKIKPYVVAEYGYTKQIESYTVERTGKYKLEVWGAQGGNSLNDYIGGYGGYATGEIELAEGEIIYIAVGGQGGGASLTEDSPGGYNGGGLGGVSLYDDKNYVTGGGGATHIATKANLLQELSSNIDEILIVAGGGGGGYYHSFGEETSNNGGCAGGYKGTDGVQCTYDETMLPATGGTQTTGGIGGYRGYDGVFGKGGDGSSDIVLGTQSTDHGASGGGGGFYGGGAAAHSGTGGGSGYIANSKLADKYMVCYKGATSSENNTKTISNENVSSDAQSDYSKIGNGYARITFIGD